MKKSFIRSIAVASVYAFSSISYASETKIAVVDMQVVEAKSVAVDDVVKKLEKEQISLREHIDNASKDLQRRARELDSKKSVLSATAVEEQRRKLESDLVSLQTEAQVGGENLQRARITSLTEVDVAVKNIVRDISKKAGYDVVFPLHSLMYLSDGKYPDITDDVITKLNSTLKTVDVQRHLSAGRSVKRVDSSSVSSGKKGAKK
jgi:Skp family chaperone for outer membrane proteins